MVEGYHTTDVQPSPLRPERSGASRRPVIEAAKEAVPTIELADRLCGPCALRKAGDRWVGRCPLPDHDDRSPSFTVYPHSNTWFCYGCSRGGDVIELARYAWGYEKREVPMAAADLLNEFGHEIPLRPASWYAKQRRQQEVRVGLDKVRVQSTQRRLFRLFEGYLMSIEDPTVRLAEAENIYAALHPLAVMIVGGTKGSGA
jgi:hypothetical protein